MGMRELGRYVKKQREVRQVSQRQLAEAVGIARSYVSKIESGEQQGIGYGVLRGLAGALAVEIRLLESLLYDRAEPAPVGALALLPIAVPVVAQGNAGKGGGYVEDYVYLSPSEAHGRLVRAVRVAGHCMEPDIREGDTVIVDADATPRDGDTVVAVLSDSQEVLVKRYYLVDGQVELRPNQGDPVRVHPRDVRIEGVVFQITRTIQRRRGDA